MLSLAQIEGDAVQLERNPESVGPLVDDILSFFRSQAEQEDIALQLDTSEEPVYARLDSRAFDRVLSNLVSNALKFTEEGHVYVQVQQEEEHVVITVEDTGIGIGLTIAKRLVDRMGGEITIESEKDVGTTVTLRFPSVEDPVVGLGG